MPIPLSHSLEQVNVPGRDIASGHVGELGVNVQIRGDSHAFDVARILVTSSEQLSYDHNSITGFLFCTVFLWSGRCPGLEGADTSLGTELTWA